MLTAPGRLSLAENGSDCRFFEMDLQECLLEMRTIELPRKVTEQS